MKPKLALTVLIFVVFQWAPAAAPERIVVGDFSSGALDGWEKKEFSGETDYEIVQLDGQGVLAAESDGTASGYVNEIEIDLEETPYLNWSWRVENVLHDVDETTKEGDDYAARIYVVFSGGLFFWRTKALNYVWASNQPKGTAWPNAFTSNAMMIAVESGDGNVGQWQHYKRNIREDYERYFGDDIEQADAVAIMTDTDNSGQQARAYYGDIYFSSE